MTALTTFSNFGVEPASALATPGWRVGHATAGHATNDSLASSGKLSSGISALDEFFDGGLPFGSIVEWGVPFGLGGRDVVLAFLSRTPRDLWTLWIGSKPQFTIYPPAWQARGIDLERIRFTCSLKPVEEMKPALLDPFFKIVVFDAPRHFSDDDCAFVARQARASGQLVLILRDFLLGSRRGNVWARYRVNCWRPAPRTTAAVAPEETLSALEKHRRRRRLCLQSIRGLSSKKIAYDPPDPFCGFVI